MKNLLEWYLKELTKTNQHGDATEESFYSNLNDLIMQVAEALQVKKVDVTTLPKKTEAGNPDFRVWDGKTHITGYIEAKAPTVANLDVVETSEQLKRYLTTFPNVILTNFYEFRLYRDGERVAQAMIGRSAIARKVKTTPPVEHVGEFRELFDKFFSFSVPSIKTARALAVELAKRTRFLRDEVIAVEIEETDSEGHQKIHGYYEAFQTYLIGTINRQQFADLYAQTITYGLFAARTRAKDKEEFNREAAFGYIPHTIGILRDVFRFISLEEPPKSLRVIVEDIAEILHATDVGSILSEYYKSGKGKDPIIHFYETFLETYDPKVRERRGVYYTPEPVVRYIVRAIHSILKSRFGLADGLADKTVKLLDPAGGTLTFPAEAVRLAAGEYRDKYGDGSLTQWIRTHVLENFYAFELMMAPYAIGHLKMGFIFEELGYRLGEDERFKLYLTNTLEMEEISQTAIPGLSSLSEESRLAGRVKKEQPVLVILGNPPYSANSANINDWTERLLKEDTDGAQSYYTLDGEPLGERNPKLLQDDYVKFLRFAQWKIETSGKGVVGMITNHSYLDNVTFRGMRQSLLKTFNEIFILNLHGNSNINETTPEGGSDENVFDIRQGVSIALFIKHNKKNIRDVFYKDLFGLRDDKYAWLNKSPFSEDNFTNLQPESPWYFYIYRNTENIKHYNDWKSTKELFPINSSGITTHRDDFVIDFLESDLTRRIEQFRNLTIPNDFFREAFKLKEKEGWSVSGARNELLKDQKWVEKIKTFYYRPFDMRKLYYSEILVNRTRSDVMSNMLEENISFLTCRQISSSNWYHVLISENIVDDSLISNKSREKTYCHPLYI